MNTFESFSPIPYIEVNNSNSKLVKGSTMSTWAAGIEMEHTYVLNPLSKKGNMEDNLKQFYILDIGKIVKYIIKKYKNSNIYRNIPEAEVSGRKCGGVSIIKPDPRHSMLEIATNDPFSLKSNIKIEKNNILYYSKKIISLQKKSIKDLNIFYKNEKLWENKHIYNSVIPYPYSMSNRLKNADIILDNMKDTKKKTNYTGSYHITLTLPFKPLENRELYYEKYKRYINQFQWIEPLIVALYTTTDMRGIGSKKVYSRASYRILLSGWGNPAGSDVRKFDQGLTRKVNIPLYWRKGLHFPGKDKVEKYCGNPKRKYDNEYVDPDRDLFDMGGDFRTPSGGHGENWSVRNRLKGEFNGVEMRILDYFPPRHMASLLRIIVFLLENSRNKNNEIYVYEDKDWIKTIQNVFKDGWRAELPKNYIKKLEKALYLRFPTKPTMLYEFWSVFLETLYEKNNNGLYVREMLPEYIKNENNIGIFKYKQPMLDKRNPNKESWDFGFLLKLNDSKNLRETIIHLFQSLEMNKKISINDFKKHYKKNISTSWSNNMVDMVYFFSERKCLTIYNDKNGFIKYISLNEKEHSNIKNVIIHYIDSILELWPELKF